MGAGTVLSWIGSWLINVFLAFLISTVSDKAISFWWAFVGILAFDFVRWLITTIYAQVLWTFFFKGPTIKGLKDALRNEGMPKFDNVKEAKVYFEWIYDSSPHDRDKNGNPISIHARVAAAKIQGSLDAMFASGQWLGWWRIRSAHDVAVLDYMNSPHVAPNKAMTMNEFMEAMNPDSPFLDKPKS